MGKFLCQRKADKVKKSKPDQYYAAEKIKDGTETGRKCPTEGGKRRRARGEKERRRRKKLT
ncbi:hypothetical protein THS27_15885 [Thalassospira sp. MCCC 1A01428]|nr:hypothetical protein THS27_15885 [Thalassospira sp. MCCC 1A01428]